MSLKITAAGRNWTVTISRVPGFCCSAHTRIRGREFESRDCPCGFESAATDSLLSRVQATYPAARFANAVAS